MGKGGGKCSSKESCGSSVESMTPKSKTYHGHHQSNTKAKGMDRVVDTNYGTFVPFIPKKVKSSQTQLEEDETIDTNIMVDQQPQSTVSEFGIRLLGPPSSIVQSAHSTSMLSPIYTFSNVNGESSNSTDELQHVQTSTSHPKHLQFSASMPPQVGEIGSSTKSSFDSTLPSLQRYDDLVPTKDTIIPSYSSNLTIVRPRLRRKKMVSNAFPSKSKGILAKSTTKLPTVGAVAGKSLLPILGNLQTSPTLMQAPLSPGPSEKNDVIKAGTLQGHKVELKEVVDPQALLMSKYFRGRLNDSWDLMPQQLGLGSFSPEPTKPKTDVKVDPHADFGIMTIGEENVFMVTNNLKESELEEKEAISQLSTNAQEEPLDLVEMKNKTLFVEFVPNELPTMGSYSIPSQSHHHFENDHMVRSSIKDQINEIHKHSIIGDAEGCTLPRMTKIKELPKSLAWTNMLSKDVILIQNDQSLPLLLPQMESKVLNVEKLEQGLMAINPRQDFKALELEVLGSEFDTTLHDLSAKGHLVKETKVAFNEDLEKSRCLVFNEAPSKAMSKVSTPNILGNEGVPTIKEFQVGIRRGGKEVGAKPTLEEDPHSMELDEAPNDDPHVSTCDIMEERHATNIKDTQVMHVPKEVKELEDRPTLGEVSTFIMFEDAPIQKLEEVNVLKFKEIILDREPQLGILKGETNVEVKPSSNEELNLKIHELPSAKLVEKVVQKALEIPIVGKEKNMKVVEPLEEQPPSLLEFYDALSEQLEFPTFDTKVEDIAKLEDFEILTSEKRVVGDGPLIQEASQRIVLQLAPIAKLEKAPVVEPKQGTIFKSNELQLDNGDEENGIVAKSRVEEALQSLKFQEVPIEEIEQTMVVKVIKLPLSKEERHLEVEFAMGKESWSTKLEKALQDEQIRLPIVETKDLHFQQLDKVQVPIIHKEKEVVDEPKLKMTTQSNIHVKVPIEIPKEVFVRELVNEKDILKLKESQLSIIEEGSVSMRLIEIHHLVEKDKHFQIEPCVEGPQSTKLDEAFNEQVEMIPILTLDLTKFPPPKTLSNDVVQKMKETQIYPIVKQVGNDLMLDVEALQSSMCGEASTKNSKGVPSMEMEEVVSNSKANHTKEDVPKLKVPQLSIEGGDLEEDIESSLKRTPQIKKFDMDIILEATRIPYVQKEKHVEVQPHLTKILHSKKLEKAFHEHHLEVPKIETKGEIVLKLEFPQLGIAREEICIGIEPSSRKESQTIEFHIKAPIQPCNVAQQLTTFDGGHSDKLASMALDEKMEKSEIEPQHPLEEPQIIFVFDDVPSEEFKGSICGTKKHILLESMELQTPIDEGEKEVEVEPILIKEPQSIILQKDPIQEGTKDLGIDLKNVTKLQKNEGPWELDQTWEEIKRN